MPVSKNRKNHKQKSNNFKTKQQRQMNQNQMQMPEVRNVPTWDPNATIEITGLEWEAIQNGLANVQIAQQAAASVMSRNILNGTIKMDFQKLNPQTLQYEEMDAKEKETYVKQFEESVAAFKAQQAEMAKNASKPIDAIVTPAEAVKETATEGSGLVTAEGEPIAKAKRKARVVKMDAKK